MVMWGVQLVASEPPRAPGYYTIIVVLSLLGVLELGSGISSAAGYGNIAVTQRQSRVAAWSKV